MPFLEILIVSAIVVGVIYLMLPRPRFKVWLVSGAPRVTGKVPADFVETIVQVCEQQHVTHGSITGVARGRLTALKFSSNIPPEAQQRLRNVWANARR